MGARRHTDPNKYHHSSSKREHTCVAEKALGKSLPLGAEVHHVDGCRGNNDNANLVICQDHVYHALLHVRSRAYKETGSAHKRKCYFCKEWDDKENMLLHGTEHPEGYVHRACRIMYKQEWNRANVF